MDNTIQFFWEGVPYAIPMATVRRKILLPNGQVLKFNGFLKTCPPQLTKLQKLDFIVMILPTANLDAVAANLDAVLAKELGHCPEHIEEYGPFCRQCGRPITPPVILPPKPPFPFTSNDSPVNVMGNGPCPSCKKLLDHSAHASTCPHCGQALQWTCRGITNTDCLE